MIPTEKNTWLKGEQPSPSTASRSQLELLVTGGNRSARRLRLLGNHWTIGAGLECSIRVDGFDVKPVHAELTLGNDGLQVFTRTGKIRVNGTVVHESKLVVQDHFEVGGYRFQVSRLELPEFPRSTTQPTIDPQLGRISFSQQMRLAKGKRDHKRTFSPQRPFPRHSLAPSGHPRIAPMVDPGLAFEHRLLQLEEQLRVTAEQAARLAVAEAEQSRAQTADFVAERTKLQQSTTQLELRIAELEEAVEQSHREAHAERQAQRKSLAQIQELEHALSSLKDQSRSEREQLQAQASSLQQTIDRLAESIEHERNQWAQQRIVEQEQSARLQMSVDDLTRQWRESQAALEQSREELRNVHEQLQVAQGEREQAYEQARELEGRLLEVSAALEQRTCVGDDQELHSRLTTVQDELRSVRSELQALVKQRDELREAVLTLEEKLKHVSKEREMIQAVCDRQARDLEEMETSLRDQGRKFREEQANWQSERASLQDERVVLAEALEALQLGKPPAPANETKLPPVDNKPGLSSSAPAPPSDSGTRSEFTGPQGSKFEEQVASQSDVTENEQVALPSWWTSQPEPSLSTEAYFESSSAFEGDAETGHLDSSSFESTFAEKNMVSWSGPETPSTANPLAIGLEQFVEESAGDHNNALPGTNVFDREVARSTSSPEFSPPESAADLLAGIGHNQDEDSTADNTDQSSVPQPTSHFRYESATGDEDEASIEEYMNRLLQRMQGRDEPSPSQAAAAPAQAAKPPPAKSMAETLPHKPRVKTVELSETSEFTPRAPAPERTSDIAAMRELANSTARSAIAASHRRSAIGAASTKIAVCGIAAATGVTLLIWSGITLSITTFLAGICFAATAVWGFDAFATYRTAIRASQRPKQTLKGEKKPQLPESKESKETKDS